MPFISRPATGCCCWLAGPSVSSKYLHLRGSEIHQQQKRRDPGSTFFHALRPTSSLKSNPPCAPSSSTSGVHKTSQAFLTALGSDGGTRCTQYRTSHTGEKTQKVTWTDHAKSPATAFCQRIPKDLLQRCFSGWSPEISYNISDRFIRRGGHKKGRGRWWRTTNPQFWLAGRTQIPSPPPELMDLVQTGGILHDYVIIILEVLPGVIERPADE